MNDVLHGYNMRTEPFWKRSENKLLVETSLGGFSIEMVPESCGSILSVERENGLKWSRNTCSQRR